MGKASLRCGSPLVGGSRDVPCEKGQLFGDVVLEGIADVDVEVPAGLHSHFALRGLPHMPQGGARRGQRVVLADREVRRARDLAGVAPREVAHDVGAEPGRDVAGSFVPRGMRASIPATESGEVMSAVEPGSP